MRGRYRVILNMRWLILLLCIGMLVSGCTKQRAKMALNKAKKVLSQAERQEAEKYKPDLLEQTRSSINEADSHFQGHRYARSLEVAKRAVELAKKYSTENSGGFVNGILDRIRKDKIGILKSINE